MAMKSSVDCRNCSSVEPVASRPFSESLLKRAKMRSRVVWIATPNCQTRNRLNQTQTADAETREEGWAPSPRGRTGARAGMGRDAESRAAGTDR